MSTIRPRTLPDPAAHRLARGLGWFSIGLGLVELLAPGPLAAFLGVPRSRALIRACGVRELVTGVGLLLGGAPRPWVHARLGGDLLDLAGLGCAAEQGRAPRNVALAAGAVAGVTALDAACALRLAREAVPRPVWDYSDRSGFPDVAESMRGLAEPAVTTARAQPNGFPMDISPTLH